MHYSCIYLSTRYLAHIIFQMLGQPQNIIHELKLKQLVRANMSIISYFYQTFQDCKNRREMYKALMEQTLPPQE